MGAAILDLVKMHPLWSLHRMVKPSACILAFAFAAAGCDPPARTSEVEKLADQLDAQRIEIEELESRIELLETKTENNRSLLGGTQRHLNGLTDTVNSNVEVERRNLLREATAKGQCGNQLIQHEGWIENRTVQCTPEMLGWDE